MMQEITIKDRSDPAIKMLKERYGIIPCGGERYARNHRENVHNDVKVTFGVDGDVTMKIGLFIY